MSVLAAGIGGKIDVDDLGLKKNFSLSNAAFSGPEYNDCMIEVLILLIILHPAAQPSHAS